MAEAQKLAAGQERGATTRVPQGIVRAAADLAPFIDHTLLKPEATPSQIARLCEEAAHHGFAGVCVNGSHVALAAQLLSGSAAKVIAVAGFPLGAMTRSAKAFEAGDAVQAGAREIDMVLNLGQLKANHLAEVERDIRAVVDAAGHAPVKVILETWALTREEKISACKLAMAAGAAFVKTSTGFGASGATAEDVALLREIVVDQLGVKASGGIRTAADAMRMIEAGANRIGASASVAIVSGKA
jgi:deoxyribose-phosphate aldolase